MISQEKPISDRRKKFHDGASLHPSNQGLATSRHQLFRPSGQRRRLGANVVAAVSSRRCFLWDENAESVVSNVASFFCFCIPFTAFVVVVDAFVVCDGKEAAE